MQNKFLQTLLFTTALVISTGAIAMHDEETAPPNRILQLRQAATRLSQRIEDELLSAFMSADRDLLISSRALRDTLPESNDQQKNKQKRLRGMEKITESVSELVCYIRDMHTCLQHLRNSDFPPTLYPRRAPFSLSLGGVSSKMKILKFLAPQSDLPTDHVNSLNTKIELWEQLDPQLQKFKNEALPRE